MEARVKLLGHPIHQMLIVLPLGILTGAVIFDIVHPLAGGGHDGGSDELDACGWNRGGLGVCHVSAGLCEFVGNQSPSTCCTCRRR